MNTFLIILIILVLIIGIGIIIPMYKYLKFQKTVYKTAINEVRGAIFRNSILELPNYGDPIIIKLKNGSIASGIITDTNTFEADVVHSFKIDSTVVFSWAYYNDLKEINIINESNN